MSAEARGRGPTKARLAEIRASIERVGAPGPVIELLAHIDALEADLAERRRLGDAMAKAAERALPGFQGIQQVLVPLERALALHDALGRRDGDSR